MLHQRDARVAKRETAILRHICRKFSRSGKHLCSWQYLRHDTESHCLVCIKLLACEKKIPTAIDAEQHLPDELNSVPGNNARREMRLVLEGRGVRCYYDIRQNGQFCVVSRRAV